MKVILQKNVENLGHIGEIKEVKDGYARNYLLPNKLVILANSSSLKAKKHQDFLIERKHAKHLIVMDQFAQKLSELGSVKIEAAASPNEEDTKLYGSVTATQIAELLKQKGLILDKRKIVLKERIQRIGEYQIPIHLAEDLNLKLHLIVVKQAPKPETRRKRTQTKHYQTPLEPQIEQENSANTEASPEQANTETEATEPQQLQASPEQANTETEAREPQQLQASPEQANTETEAREPQQLQASPEQANTETEAREPQQFQASPEQANTETEATEPQQFQASPEQANTETEATEPQQFQASPEQANTETEATEPQQFQASPEQANTETEATEPQQLQASPEQANTETEATDIEKVAETDKSER